MALINKLIPYLNPNTGETLVIRDLTGLYDPINNPGGYGGPNVSVNAINATRFVFGSYLQELAATTSTTITAGYEYIVSGASLTWDTKTYIVGEIFISMISGTPTLGSSAITLTGRFCPVLGFLPTQVSTSNIVPSQVGEDNTTFADTPRSLTYEIYDTVYGAGTLRPAGTYIVINNTVTISGVTYRIGEQFVKSGTFTTSGSGSVVKHNDTATINFQTFYNYYQAIKDLDLKITSATCGCSEKELIALRECWAMNAAISYNYSDNLGLSTSLVQSIMESIITTTQIANNCS